MKKHLFTLLMFLGVVSCAFAQRAITGKISNAQGEPLIGASVVIKGTTTGTITDVDGNFALNAPANALILSIGFVGHVSQDVTLGA